MKSCFIVPHSSTINISKFHVCTRTTECMGCEHSAVYVLRAKYKLNKLTNVSHFPVMFSTRRVAYPHKDVINTRWSSARSCRPAASVTLYATVTIPRHFYNVLYFLSITIIRFRDNLIFAF